MSLSKRLKVGSLKKDSVVKSRLFRISGSSELSKGPSFRSGTPQRLESNKNKYESSPGNIGVHQFVSSNP